MSAPEEDTDLSQPLWSVEKVAEYFGVQKSTVLRWIKDERAQEGAGMKARKINNRWKITAAEVIRFRNERYAQGAAS